MEVKKKCSTSIWSGHGRGLWSRIVQADLDLSRWLATELVPEPCRRFFRYLFLVLEYTGHGIPWICLALYWLISSSDQSARHMSMLLLLGLIVDLLFVCLVKVIAARPRPPYNEHHILLSVAVDRDNAFPSGHASRAVYLLGMAAAYSSGLSLVLTAVWALSLCASRVMMGRHHVLDIVAAFLVGIFEAVFTLACLDGLAAHLLQLIS